MHLKRHKSKQGQSLIWNVNNGKFFIKKLWEWKNTWLKSWINFQNTKSTRKKAIKFWRIQLILRELRLLRERKKNDWGEKKEMRCPCNENSSQCCRIGVYSSFGVTILLTVKCWKMHFRLQCKTRDMQPRRKTSN